MLPGPHRTCRETLLVLCHCVIDQCPHSGNALPLCGPSLCSNQPCQKRAARAFPTRSHHCLPFVTTDAALFCLPEFSDGLKKHRSFGVFVFFSVHLSGGGAICRQQSYEGAGGGSAEGRMWGCWWWGLAAYPQLGHQSRSVACRCTF